MCSERKDTMREQEWRVLIQSGGQGRGPEEWTSELRCAVGGGHSGWDAAAFQAEGPARTKATSQRPGGTKRKT